MFHESECARERRGPESLAFLMVLLLLPSSGVIVGGGGVWSSHGCLPDWTSKGKQEVFMNAVR